MECVVRNCNSATSRGRRELTGEIAATMYAPFAVGLFSFVFIINLCESVPENSLQSKYEHEIKLSDSVYMKIPSQDEPRSILSLEIGDKRNTTDEGMDYWLMKNIIKRMYI